MVIDLGSSNIRIALASEETIYEEASAIAIYQKDAGKKHVMAIGQEALKMEGKTPREIRVYHPIKDGRIADREIAALLLKHMMVEVQGRLLFVGPSVRLCVPHGLSQSECFEMKQLTTFVKNTLKR